MGVRIVELPAPRPVDWIRDDDRFVFPVCALDEPELVGKRALGGVDKPGRHARPTHEFAVFEYSECALIGVGKTEQRPNSDVVDVRFRPRAEQPPGDREELVVIRHDWQYGDSRTIVPVGPVVSSIQSVP